MSLNDFSLYLIDNLECIEITVESAGFVLKKHIFDDFSEGLIELIRISKQYNLRSNFSI